MKVHRKKNLPVSFLTGYFIRYYVQRTKVFGGKSQVFAPNSGLIRGLFAHGSGFAKITLSLYIQAQSHFSSKITQNNTYKGFYHG